MPIDRSTVPVFVLCGGLGTRLREETEFRPKPMVPVGSRPILWHIMSEYSGYGFKKFVLCLGYKAEVVKDYFLNYKALNCDFTLDLHGQNLTVHNSHEQDWNVTLVDTGEKAMTGARVAKAAKKYLGDATHFAVTYGDGLTDVNLAQEFEFHQKHDRLGTVLAVNPPSRFGELKLDGDKCLEFSEKPDFVDNWINGGYFFFRRPFLRYLSESDECVLEQEPLVRLARDGQLTVYKHRGFWACMDTQRDREHLDKIWNTGNAPWKPGKPKEG